MSKNADGTYDNDLSGALFKNEKRREGKKDPHYQGSCEIDGQEYWIAGWKKRSKSGLPYMNLSFTPKADISKDANKSDKVIEDDDDIPF